MLNLMRIEIYRLLKGKAFYISLGIFIIIALFSQLLVYAVANPEVAEKLREMGFIISATGDINELGKISIVEVFHRSGASGGMFAMVVGCLASTMVRTDFEYGFIKNILSIHENKWRYILSKIVSLSFVNLLYITVSFAMTLVINSLVNGYFVVPPVADILFFGVSYWFLLNGFVALIIMIYMVTRSNGIAIASSILLGSGTVVTMLGALLGFFNADKIINYTLYMNMSTCPYKYVDIKSLQALMVGTICLIFYTVVAKLVLAQRDI